MNTMKTLFIPFALMLAIGCGKKNSQDQNKQDSTSTSTSETTQPVKTSAVNWDGTYENKEGGGTLNITNYKEGSDLTFKISVVAESDEFCEGNTEGKAKWVDAKTASYKATGEFQCELNFTFSDPNTIIVKEEICDQHGETCSFGGTYKKQ